MGSLYHELKKFVRLSYKVSIISACVYQTNKPGFHKWRIRFRFHCNYCAMENYTCKCGLDADTFEGDSQHRWWYDRCPKRV